MTGWWMAAGLLAACNWGITHFSLVPKSIHSIPHRGNCSKCAVHLTEGNSLGGVDCCRTGFWGSAAWWDVDRVVGDSWRSGFDRLLDDWWNYWLMTDSQMSGCWQTAGLMTAGWLTDWLLTVAWMAEAWVTGICFFVLFFYLFFYFFILFYYIFIYLLFF